MANRVPPSSSPPPPGASEERADANAEPRFAEESITKVRGQGAVSPVRTTSLKSSLGEAQNVPTTRVDVSELRAALRASKRSDPPEPGRPRSPSNPGSMPPETARGSDALARKLDALALASLEAPRVPADLAVPPTPRMPSNPSLEPPDERALGFGSRSEAGPRPLSHAEVEALGTGPSSEVPSTKRSSTAPALARSRKPGALRYVIALGVVLGAGFLGLLVASGGSFARMGQALRGLFGR
jgi:hypothetical protein